MLIEAQVENGYIFSELAASRRRGRLCRLCVLVTEENALLQALQADSSWYDSAALEKGVDVWERRTRCTSSIGVLLRLGQALQAVAERYAARGWAVMVEPYDATRQRVFGRWLSQHGWVQAPGAEDEWLFRPYWAKRR